MPYVVVKRKSYSSRHVVEGLTWFEVRQVAARTGWTQVEVITQSKVAFKGNLTNHPTTDLLNALEDLGYKLISVAGYSDDDGYASTRIIGWTMHRPLPSTAPQTPTSRPPSVIVPNNSRDDDTASGAPPSYEAALAAMTPVEFMQRRSPTSRHSRPPSPLATTPAGTHPAHARLVEETQRRGSMPTLYPPRPPSVRTRRSNPNSPLGSSENLSIRGWGQSGWDGPDGGRSLPNTAPPSPGYLSHPLPPEELREEDPFDPATPTAPPAEEAEGEE